MRIYFFIADKESRVLYCSLIPDGVFFIFIAWNNLVLGNLAYYEGESIKQQPNLFLGEIDLFFFNVIAL